MGLFSYIEAENSILKDAVIVASSEDSNYPKGRMVAVPVSKRTRSVAGVTTANWLFDRSAAGQADTVIVGNHNLSATATVTLEAGTSSAVTDFSQVLTWRKRDMIDTFAVQNYRWWKLTAVDSSNVDSQLRIGYLMAGLRVAVPVNVKDKWGRRLEQINRTVRTDFGVDRTKKLWKRYILDFNFGFLSQANANTVMAFFEGLNGDAETLFIMPDPAVLEGYIVKLASNPQERVHNAVGGRLHTITDIVFRETGAGDVLGA